MEETNVERRRDEIRSKIQGMAKDRGMDAIEEYDGPAGFLREEQDEFVDALALVLSYATLMAMDTTAPEGTVTWRERQEGMWVHQSVVQPLDHLIRVFATWMAQVELDPRTMSDDDTCPRCGGWGYVPAGRMPSGARKRKDCPECTDQDEGET